MPIINELHAVKRGNEIQELRISNIPQRPKIVISPIMKLTTLTVALPAHPTKCYLIHGVSIGARNTAGDVGVMAQVYCTPYGESSTVGILICPIVPSVANTNSVSTPPINVLTQPNTVVGNTATDVGVAYTIVYYSEVDIIDG